jgi:F0F1-type ATP synthase beta subunit
MTQNLFVVESQSGKEGKYVPLKKTVKEVREILDGLHDTKQEEKMMFLGSLGEYKE